MTSIDWPKLIDLLINGFIGVIFGAVSLYIALLIKRRWERKGERELKVLETNKKWFMPNGLPPASVSAAVKQAEREGYKVKIIVAIIGILVIFVGTIQVASVISNIQPTPSVIPAAALEAELSKANIILSDVPNKSSLVRQWLISDPQYQAMAQSTLTALRGKKVIDSIPLDVIIGKYRILLGGDFESNFPADQYRDIEKTKDAIFDTWKERHPNFPQKSFDEIIEDIG